MAERSGWEHFHHEADVGVRGYGRDPAEAFANAARAMVAIITPPDRIALRDSVTVTCQSADPEILLNDWLNAVIYEMATRKALYGDFRVEIDGDTLTGTMTGEPTDPARHEPAVEIKGATMTELAVYQGGDGRWVAQSVVDV